MHTPKNTYAYEWDGKALVANSGKRNYELDKKGFVTSLPSTLGPLAFVAVMAGIALFMNLVDFAGAGHGGNLSNQTLDLMTYVGAAIGMLLAALAYAALLEPWFESADLRKLHKNRPHGRKTVGGQATYMVDYSERLYGGASYTLLEVNGSRGGNFVARPISVIKVDEDDTDDELLQVGVVLAQTAADMEEASHQRMINTQVEREVAVQNHQEQMNERIKTLGQKKELMGVALGYDTK